MAKRKQSWEVGDVFSVQLINGKFVIGQIVGREAKVLNSVTVAFYDLQFATELDAAQHGLLQQEKIFSIVFSTRELLDAGSWHVIGHSPVTVHSEDLPYESLRASGFVGAKIYGAGILEEFLNAFYGLMAWDDWKDPQYLDRLLLSPNKKPLQLIYKNPKQ